MQKQHQTRANPNKYKDIIKQRLATNNYTTNKKNNSQIHSLKTQCTPNDKTQDICEKIFEDFQANFKLKYNPIITHERTKPIGRCLYPELLQTIKKQQSKSKSKSKHKQGRVNTQIVEVSEFKFDNIKVQLKKNQSKSNLKDGSRKKIQNKNNNSHFIGLKRQNSLNHLQFDKQKSIKKCESKQDLRQISTKHYEAIGQNLKKYSFKNLRSLSKK